MVLSAVDATVPSVFKIPVSAALPMKKVTEQPGLLLLALVQPLKLYRVLAVTVTARLNQAWYTEAPEEYATEAARAPPWGPLVLTKL